MTEEKEIDTLTVTAREFILHWGEMGTRWGLNRTVAQVHALLYLSSRPLNAEEISDTLAVARSTVSTSLRELRNWGIVKEVHVLGDRRSHFEAMDDVWAMFRIVLDRRKQRELDPTLEILRQAVAEMATSLEEDSQTVEKLENMLEFFETINTLYEQVNRLPMETILQIAKLGNLGALLQRFSAT